MFMLLLIVFGHIRVNSMVSPHFRLKDIVKVIETYDVNLLDVLFGTNKLESLHAQVQFGNLPVRELELLLHNFQVLEL